MGTQCFQLTHHSTYYGHQVTNFSLRLKYQINMISKIFPIHLWMAVSKEAYCLLFFVFFPIKTLNNEIRWNNTISKFDRYFFQFFLNHRFILAIFYDAMFHWIFVSICQMEAYFFFWLLILRLKKLFYDSIFDYYVSPVWLNKSQIRLGCILI